MNLPVAIVGASGFSGATLITLLAQHPHVDIAFLGSQNHVGKNITDLYPSLHRLVPLLPQPILQSNLELFAQAQSFHTVFCGLPHTETPEIISKLLDKNPKLRIIDLSAALRLKDEEIYRQYYQDSFAHDLVDQSIYGLCEIYRDSIPDYQIIANPGCYTTTSLLPLIPLFENHIIKSDDIIIDAKSGVSGAGRKADVNFSYTSIAENFKAYSLEGHRHEPEILQELQQASKRSSSSPSIEPSIMFSPQLTPMKRGILAHIYVKSIQGDSYTIWQTLDARYRNEPFVQILPYGDIPSTHHANYTNACVIGVVKRSIGTRCLVVSVTDNLIKGAAGQAIQNFNILADFNETIGLQPTSIAI